MMDYLPTNGVPIIPNYTVQKFVKVVTRKYQHNLNLSINILGNQF